MLLQSFLFTIGIKVQNSPHGGTQPLPRLFCSKSLGEKFDEEGSELPGSGSDSRRSDAGVVANKHNDEPPEPGQCGRPVQTRRAWITGKQVRLDGHAIGCDTARGVAEQTER
jgi:hypothetical protein